MRKIALMLAVLFTVALGCNAFAAEGGAGAAPKTVAKKTVKKVKTTKAVTKKKKKVSKAEAKKTAEEAAKKAAAEEAAKKAAAAEAARKAAPAAAVAAPAAKPALVMCGTVMRKDGKDEITGWHDPDAAGKCGSSDVTVTGTPVAAN